MKKTTPKASPENSINVKEISDGVYINLNRISTDETEFEKAIEKSFKEIEDADKDKNQDQKGKLK